MSRADVLAGKWDDPGAHQTPPFRCRWFFSWSEPEPGRIAGYFAGYEGGDVPPVLSSTAIWSPIPNDKEIGREEAFFRRTDHRLPA